MATTKKTRARDISAPIDHVTLDGVRYPLVYNNSAARVTEDIYEDVFKRDKPYGEILKELAAGKWRAIMAIFYGALIAGGTDMSWEEFDAKYTLDAIDGIQEMVQRSIARALPDPDPKAAQDENP